MTEAMLESPRSPPTAAAGVPPRAVNGAALRWTPGPDERRLPSCEDGPVPQNLCRLGEIADSFVCLRRHWRGCPDVLVGADQFLYWDPTYHAKKNPENSPPAPDLYVAFGVAKRRRKSYVAWEEGKPPDFALEVVSPSSRARDVKEKPELYARIGVPEFFLYDPGDEDEQALPGVDPALAGFELRGGRGGKYQPLPKEMLPGGLVGIRSKVLGLCVCVERADPEQLDGSLRWYDPVAGAFLETHDETADDRQRLADDNQRLADDRQRLADDNQRLADGKREADARVAELEALVEKMRRG